jgi:DNA-binding response OmpR family regulator
MKILIIDDELGISKLYSEKLNNEGFEVLTAQNGLDGFALAKKELPNLILLDIIMPKMNGLDTLKQLKEDESTKAIPVILLTNLPAEMSMLKARQLGAVDYLVKAEYDPIDVVIRIRTLLSGQTT